MPTEDLGAAAFRKIDIEAWMPSRNAFGEVNCFVCILLIIVISFMLY